MRKQLLVTLALLAGAPMCGYFSAYAEAAPMQQSPAEQTITGTVFDENNDPVIGATVSVKGNPAKAVNTNFDGQFTLRVQNGAVLNISYVGYAPVSVAATPNMQVYLKPSVDELDQLVVVGYGTQKKANLTGAVTTVDVAQALESRPQQDVMKALQGAVPGLTITQGTGNINGTPSIRIRGTGSLNGTPEPLIVVDGVPMDDISYLDPNDIKDISVMKDASSSSIYGTRAAFGVILITTKTGTKRDKVQIRYSNNFAWSQATILPEFSSTVDQLYASNESAKMTGASKGEFFGQYYTTAIPYAEKWAQQNKPIDSYRQLHLYQDENNIGDFYVNENGNGWIQYADFDINKIMINNAAPSNSHNVTIDGSSGKAVFNVSFGYAKRQSLINFNPDKVTRYNAKADLQLNLYDWLQTGVRFSYAQRNVETTNVGQNIWGHVWRFPAYLQMPGYVDVDGTEWDFKNNIAYLKNSAIIPEHYIQNRMQAWARATVLPGLTINADFTYARNTYDTSYAYLPFQFINNWNGNLYSPTYAVTQAASTSTKSNSHNERWTMNIYGTYDLTIANDHNIKVMLGTNVEENRYSSFLARTKVLLDNSLPALNLYTGDLVAPTSSDSHWATAGFFGRINYDYKGIYLFEINGRYDGSSRFPANDQWAFFTSGSIGYRFSEEKYFEPLKSWWSNGKIRASYGEVGNQGVGTNRFISTIGTYNYNWVTSAGILQRGASTPAVVSNSLTWERICTTDIGIDLGFLKNEITASFDWFQRDNKDMLAPGVTLPAVLGADAPYQNAGGLRNRGWELSLGWNHRFHDVGVYASFNISDVKTVVTKWNNPSRTIGSNYSGKEYGTIWGFETDRYYTEDDFVKNEDGTFQKDASGNFIPKPGIVDQRGLQQGSFKFGPGDIMYKDQNGDGVINGGEGTAENKGDIIKIGNQLPRYEYSFHLGADWKGIDVDMFFQGVGKCDMWTVSSMVIPFTQAPNDIYYKHMASHNSVIYDDAWNITGYVVDQSNTYPRLWPGCYASNNVSGLGNGQNNYIPQTKYLQDLSYLRVKNVTVGYTFPREWTSKAYIQRLRVYFSGDNLFFLHRGNKNTSPIDPEINTTEWSGVNTVGRTNPIQRSYSFGLQVTF
ncbi:MAG: TonB-dependent receptor [Clostridium sp.]|nr:TonB-dependent receptor [Clostridium sp.]